MKNIKYRAWCEERKDFIFVSSIDLNNKECHGLAYDIQESDEEICLSTDLLEQFTGLVDMNGVEIYEGDICHVEYYDRYQDCTYTSSFLHKDNGRVIFEEGCYQIEANETAYIRWFESVEVISNIHEKLEE